MGVCVDGGNETGSRLETMNENAQKPSIEIRRMLESDKPKVLDLIAEARGDALSPEERAERGFIQGTVNEGLLDAALAGPGIYLAVSGDEVAGFVMSWGPEQIGEQNRVGTESLRLAAEAFPGSRVFMSGPVAISERFQGQGLYRKMASARDAALAGDFQCAVQFVDTANVKSLNVHRHMGMTELEQFEANGSQFVPFAYAL